MHTRLVIDTNRHILTISIFVSKCILPMYYVANYLASLTQKSVISVKLKRNGKRKPFRCVISTSTELTPFAHYHKSPETYCKPMVHFGFLPFFAQKWYRHRKLWSAWVGRVFYWDSIHHPTGPIRKIHQIRQREIGLIHQIHQAKTKIKEMHRMRRYDCMKKKNVTWIVD